MIGNNNSTGIAGIYSISNLPETTKDVSPMRGQGQKFIIKRRTEAKFKEGKYKYFMLDKTYSYISSLIPIKGRLDVFDFDIPVGKSLSGEQEFYRVHMNFDKGIADVTLKAPVTV